MTSVQNRAALSSHDDNTTILSPDEQVGRRGRGGYAVLHALDWNGDGNQAKVQ